MCSAVANISKIQLKSCAASDNRYHQQRDLIRLELNVKAPLHNSPNRNHIEQILHTHLQLYGYQDLETPLIENAEIFLTRAGDKVIDQLIIFEHGNDQLALRPEFTASAANHYVQGGYSGTARWQMRGPVFADRAGRPAQNYHLGAECIGSSGPEIDAEMMAIAIKGLTPLLADSWIFQIGHVGLQMHLLNHFGLDSRTTRLLLSQRDSLRDGQQVVERIEKVLNVDITDEHASSLGDSVHTRQMLDVLLDSTRYGTTMGGRERHEIARRLIDKRMRGVKRAQIAQAADFFTTWSRISGDIDSAFRLIKDLVPSDDVYAKEVISRWHQSIMLLESYGIDLNRIQIQPDLTRNWEYYTGIVFGLRLDDGQYVAAGGRYDELLRLLGATHDIPAVGFAYYLDRLIDRVELASISPTPPVLIVRGNDNIGMERLIQVAEVLRAASVPVQIVTDNMMTSQPRLAVHEKSVMLGVRVFADGDLPILIEEIQADRL